MSVHQVSRLTHVSNRQLLYLYLYLVAARHDEDWSQVTAISMDETSVAKGREYITLMLDLEQRRTLHVARRQRKQHGGVVCAGLNATQWKT